MHQHCQGPLLLRLQGIPRCVTKKWDHLPASLSSVFSSSCIERRYLFLQNIKRQVCYYSNIQNEIL
jgi:hypothetical protein